MIDSRSGGLVDDQEWARLAITFHDGAGVNSCTWDSNLGSCANRSTGQIV